MKRYKVIVKQTQVYEIDIEAPDAAEAEHYAENLRDGADILGNPESYEYEAEATEIV